VTIDSIDQPYVARAATMERDISIIGPNDLILVTGATGFIGPRLVKTLIDSGYRNLRCFVRPSSEEAQLNALSRLLRQDGRLEIFKGNLVSQEDCTAAVKDAELIFHLAMGRDRKSYPDTFRNSVVTTRNLLEAARRHDSLRRFVNVSSLAVYSNTGKPRWRRLDETCPIEQHPEMRGDAYTFSKVKQEEIVAEYGAKFGVPCVTVRLGYVLGPGKASIPSRVGIDTFGFFLHLGGSNAIPLTYVDNCADAIALAGVRPVQNGEVFNVVDDELPTSRQFLRLYKANVKPFKSIYLPHFLSYTLCYMWERYSAWSEGQLLPAFNRKRWHFFWKKTHYSNAKLKAQFGWTPRVSMAEGVRRYFEACRLGEAGA